MAAPEPNALTVAPCTRKAAAYAVMHWHYSQAMPAGKLITFGVWESGEYIGAVIYGRGASPFLGVAYNLPQTELCELVRVALREHTAPVSQIVAASLRELKRTNPGLRLVVSFADPAEGHHGGIYQAGNWIYTGTSGATQMIHLNGRAQHVRTVGARYKTNIDWLRQNVDPNAHITIAPPKHRYLMPLDRALRRRLEKRRRPAPKPAGPDD